MTLLVDGLNHRNYNIGNNMSADRNSLIIEAHKVNGGFYMEKFMAKYSVWLSMLMGVIAAIWLVVDWANMSVLTKLPVIYIIALALHEFEELKFPGGFVELVTSMTGFQLKKPGVAKFGLFMLTIYATVVPAMLSGYVWPVMAPLLLGVIEAVLHSVTARLNPYKFYSPGLYSALFVQLPVSIYGFWYLFSHGLVQGIYFLYAFLFIFVPTIALQRAIVKANGLDYSQFMKDALSALFTKDGTEAVKEKMK